MKKFNLLSVLIFTCFSAFSQAPTITSFSPASGPVGTLVNISGTNLSSPTAFTIGGASAIIITDNGTSLVGYVMPGAVTGQVSVTTAGGIAMSSGNFSVISTQYPSTQQGGKLVGTDTGASSGPLEGSSVAISADGNTALMGGGGDAHDTGATWVFTRTGTTWTQQGPKLVGTGFAISAPIQGGAVALSADGNTAMVGGREDHIDTGSVWIFTRSAGVWTQQGPRLFGSGSVGPTILQGTSVALSADGNTAIEGGNLDSNARGAFWIFTRTGSTWTQQGSKMFGTGAVGAAMQGRSVAISADGNTAIVGGFQDYGNTGAVWIFTRSGGVWTQQGPKLVGTGAIGASTQGISVGLSADGNTAIVGGSQDNNYIGAIWIFTRSGGTWTQQGPKLVGTGAVGVSVQGCSVSLSADGNTAIEGGFGDNSDTGAVWVFTRSGGVWTQQGSKRVGTGEIGTRVEQGGAVALSADGKSSIVGGDQDNYNLGAAWVFIASCIPTSSSINQTICQGDTFILGSRQLTTSGIFTDTFTNIGGCDSILTVNLTVVTVLNTSLSDSICAGSSYTFGGQTVTTAGIYHDTLTSAAGCDSIVTLTLSINNTSGSSFVHSICSGSSYTFGGQTVTTAGIYHDTLTSAAGCDSIVTLNLSINNTSGSSFVHGICSGSSYTFGGQTVTTAGIYHDTLTSAAGCDSIVTLTLSINNTSGSSFVHSICSGSSYTFGGQTVTTAGTYHDTLTSAAGCDSIVTLNLSVTSATTSLISDTLRHGDSVTLGTHTYNQSGTYIDTLTNIGGCDSIVTLQLYIITGINDIKGLSPIHLYPNPNKGSFTLQTSGSIGSDYTISDMLGHVIMQRTIKTDTETIELPNAAEGVYTLVVKGAQPVRFIVVQ